MDEVFIIMQIGTKELDRLCDEAMVAAIEDAGFTARRAPGSALGGHEA